MKQPTWYSLWPAAAVSFCYYAIFGGFVSYLAIWLTQRGFSSAEIGALFATYTIIRIGSGQLWAHLSDKSNNPRLYLQMGMVLASACLLPAFFSANKLVVFISVVAAMTFVMSVVSQLEVLSLVAAKDDAKTYNRVRLFGSVGFIVAAVSMGWAIDIWSIDTIMYFTFVISLCCAGIAQLLNNTVVSEHQEEGKVNFWQKCLDLGFVGFMIASILLQISFAPYVGFFTQYLSTQNYSGTEVGVLFALGTFAEIFLFAIAGSLLARFNLKRLMFACLLLTSLRWWWVATYPDATSVVVLSQLIHALSFGLMHSCSIHYIRQFFSESEQNRGQFMYLGVSFGIGGAIGAAVTGMTWEEGAGGQFTFYWAAAAALLAALVLLITPKSKFQFQPHGKSL